VVIIDDHAAFRAAARRLLEAGGLCVLGEAASGESGPIEVWRLHRATWWAAQYSGSLSARRSATPPYDSARFHVPSDGGYTGHDEPWDAGGLDREE
jgi:hypothetical protein